MNQLIEQAIKRPIAVLSIVFMVVMFGLISVRTIPVQLAPDVSKPIIQITTIWPNAAPEEVEREILNVQEDELQGLEGLESITGRATTGMSEITLEFSIQQDMDKALLLVANRLDRVTNYPNEALQPSLKTAGSEDNPIAWFALKRQENTQQPMNGFGDLAEDIIKEQIERVPGVGRVNIYGGSELEMQLVLEPEKMANHQITIEMLAQVLQNAHASITGGEVNEGKRKYTIRTEGDLKTLEQVKQLVIRSEVDEKSGRIVRTKMSDIAEVQFAYSKPTAHIRFLGEPILAMNAVREIGANVIETMNGIRSVIQQLNEGELAKRGLELKQVYDETIYIDDAIDLVQRNIIIGALLAAMVLWVFLHSPKATLIISIAIPVSVIGAFVAMAALGRSLNVISLAGLAFAVGMVVDAAIVVLENIYRHRQNHESSHEAAYHGAKEVWGAVLVASLTTVMAFIPILMMELEVGQLFRDIAVALSVAVLLSLLVSITVIPALASKLFKKDWQMSHISAAGIALNRIGQRIVQLIMKLTQWSLENAQHAWGFVLSISAVAILATLFLLPKLEYLPEGNRNFVFGILMPPPGYNLKTANEMAKRLEQAVKPMWASVSGSESIKNGPPKIQNFFYVSRASMSFVGATAVERTRAAELIPILQGPVFQEPGTFGFMTQPSIFGRGIGGGRSIELDVFGPDLSLTLDTARKAMIQASRTMPRKEGYQYRPIPGLELGAPELKIIPNSQKLTDNGLSARALGLTVKAFNDGLKVDEVTVKGKRIDLRVIGQTKAIEETQSIGELPVLTPKGQIVPVSSLAEVKLSSGPTEIRHKGRERVVTLEIRPKPTLALESGMEMIQESVITPFEQEGLPEGVKLALSGTADKLTETWDILSVDLALALIIVYLVMAILLDSFLYPLVILFTVPVALAGGVMALGILNAFVYQPLDMLTMLGFIILIGVVVNNAILIVNQSLVHVREENMPIKESVLLATQHRIRPIFMSTLTSVFGMLPLVVFPGAGSELYRGLGTIVVGGLTCSAILTLIIVPPVLYSALSHFEK